MQDDISGWTEWNAHFKGIEEISSPSELHGLLTGIVCVTEAPTREEWTQILTTLNVPELNEEALALLTDEAEDVAHALSEDELTIYQCFQMMNIFFKTVYKRCQIGVLALCSVLVWHRDMFVQMSVN